MLNFKVEAGYNPGGRTARVSGPEKLPKGLRPSTIMMTMDRAQVVNRPSLQGSAGAPSLPQSHWHASVSSSSLSTAFSAVCTAGSFPRDRGSESESVTLIFLESMFIDQATFNGGTRPCNRPNSPTGVKPATTPWWVSSSWFDSMHRSDSDSRGSVFERVSSLAFSLLELERKPWVE